jgi:hypothetical protein
VKKIGSYPRASPLAALPSPRAPENNEFKLESVRSGAGLVEAKPNAPLEFEHEQLPAGDAFPSSTLPPVRRIDAEPLGFYLLEMDAGIIEGSVELQFLR